MTPSTISDVDLDVAFADIIAAEWPKLVGRQTPDALLYTQGDTTLGLKAAELGRRSTSRIRTMPWQGWSLEQILAKNADGTWTHPECCLIVPRQAGKSTILMLRVLYGLFKLGEKIIFSAHQWVTAKALWKRTFAIIKSTPWMWKRVVGHTCSQGRGTIELKSGAEVVFTTRSAHAGRGLDEIDLEIYDEAYDLTEGDMAALSPTKMAATDPQTIYTSSAVNQDQHPNGNVLASVRRRGRTGTETGLFFAEWMAEDGDRSAPETWRLSNPSFGVIATEKKLRTEYVKFSTPAGRRSFDCEYLGRGDWPADQDETAPAIDPEVWADMKDTKPRLRGQIALSIAQSQDRQWWAIGAAQATTEGRKHLEIGYYRTATHAEVVSYVLAVIAAWDPCVLVIDRKSSAAVIVPKLIAAGVEPELVGAPELAVAYGLFYDGALAHELSHTGQKILTDGIESTSTRKLPGGDDVWAGAEPPLMTATWALWGLETFGIDVAPPASPSRGATAPIHHHRSGSTTVTDSAGMDVFATAF
ncbi:hypothetical protein [Nocardia sp. NPDC058633]|uniref:hypothetical protein n=1 Tax=Nocardia sp. NPDC058633 TaxID=3346568 RepID=UPI003663BB9A